MPRQVRVRCAGVMSECHSAGRVPNRRAKRSRNVCVSAISGSRISACRPARSVSATASKNTSVLPPPVTPSSSATPNFLGSSARIWPSAAACSGLSVGGAASGSGGSTIGGAGTSSRSSAPARSSPSITDGEAPLAPISAVLVHGSPSPTVSSTRSRAGVIRSGSMPVLR
jgi:hypothetical protein